MRTINEVEIETVEIQGLEYTRPVDLPYGLRQRLTAVMMGAYGRECGKDGSSLLAEFGNEKTKAEAGAKFEAWAVENLMSPTVMFPMLDLIFKPATSDVPKISYVLERCCITEAEEKFLQDSMAFFGRGAARNITKPKKSANNSTPTSEVTGTMADLV